MTRRDKAMELARVVNTLLGQEKRVQTLMLDVELPHIKTREVVRELRRVRRAMA